MNTPARICTVKRLACRSYRSPASGLMKYISTSTNMVSEVAKKIKAEMKGISSKRHGSIVLDTIESVKNFSWERVLLQLQSMMPTLMHLLMKLESYVFVTVWECNQQASENLSFIMCKLHIQMFTFHHECVDCIGV